jgi:hypothetical protein
MFVNPILDRYQVADVVVATVVGIVNVVSFGVSSTLNWVNAPADVGNVAEIKFGLL